VQKYARKMWVGDGLLGNGITPIRVNTGDAVPQGVVPQAFHLRTKVAFLFMEKTFPISDEVLQVPNLRAVHRWIVNLGDYAVPESEPDAAVGRVGGPYAIFAPMGPPGIDTWCSKSLAQIRSMFVHRVSSSLS
jgi:hypothetical protein